MKAIVVLFDTLNRRFLPPYGARGIHAPNFERLTRRSVVFDNCYGGSMPCTPARRELHTGRYNFLHRGWGPLEPFDDSVPQLLGEAGVYTHLVTDHKHYWGDGGATYHPRFSTYEFFRGQEGDAWKGSVADPDLASVTPYASNRDLRRQDAVNRPFLADQAEHPQTRTFDAGIEFIRANAESDSWMLQIETFDPHEPFFSYRRYQDLYDTPAATGDPDFDWPDYKRVTESEDELAHLRDRYRALLSMCDDSLGRVLDEMDEHDMWDDTLLMVCTDHGLLLGEHEWLGKNVPPFYDETIHTPLFVWHPGVGVQGERREALVQSIDFGPTLLDLFGLPATPDMQGRALAAVLADDSPVRETALFGIHGGHANVTDGRHVYMRAPVSPDNQPLAEYTLMPTTMSGRFPVSTLRSAELVPPMGFTKGVPLLKVPAIAPSNAAALGTMLFDLSADPEQEHPLTDPGLERRMAQLLVEAMRDAEAPLEQYERLGLPVSGPVGDEHLVLGKETPPAEEGLSAADRALLTGTPVATRTVKQLLADPASAAVLRAVLGPIAEGPLPPEALDMSLLDIATVTTGMLPAEALLALAEHLPAAQPPAVTPRGS